MFAQRLAGHSMSGIARALNEKGVACLSGVDPQRNKHRTGKAWTLRTVAAILSNPRYTGRQVWNRQRTDHDPLDPGDRLTGEQQVRRWNPAAHWVSSERPVHVALVSEADFITAQAVNAIPSPADGSARTYHLVGHPSAAVLSAQRRARGLLPQLGQHPVLGAVAGVAAFHAVCQDRARA